MKIEIIERIKRLKKEENSLRNFFSEFDEQTSKSSCDKYGAGFNLDEKFSNFIVNVSFDSWKGYYGSPSCSRAGPNLSYDDAKDYFIKAINKHKALLFSTMADFMEEEASSLHEKAREEINAISALIDSLELEGE